MTGRKTYGIHIVGVTMPTKFASNKFSFNQPAVGKPFAMKHIPQRKQ